MCGQFVPPPFRRDMVGLPDRQRDNRQRRVSAAPVVNCEP
jgi:hypothetical protein